MTQSCNKAPILIEMKKKKYSDNTNTLPKYSIAQLLPTKDGHLE